MNERILIVDDEIENRLLLRDLIADVDDVQVDLASNGFEALTCAKQTAYDIVLLDIQMPDMNGFETFEKIKKEVKNTDASAIFITAHDPKMEEQEKGLKAGGIDYLTKPVDTEEFTRLIKLYLRFIRREKSITQKLVESNESLKIEITTRKKTEVLLAKVQENFKNIVGKSKAGILIIDNDGILKFINPSGEEIFQRKSNELVGKPFGLIADFEKKSEISILRKDKQIGTGEITATATYWEEEPAWLILINDITDHKKLQDNLLKAKEQAQKADRLKSTFLSNMSHEIRTPMNAIVGFVDILEKDTELTEEDRKKFLAIVRSSSNHLLSLVTDIVDISKIEAGQMTITLKECNVSELILEIYELFATHSKIIDNNLDLSFEIPIGENLVVRTDSDRLKQVLINLIGNAIKYTDEGYIKFGFSIEKNTRLLFFVKDSGAGIPVDYHKRIFERFEQVVDEKRKYISGTGLGLAISKSLVELLGGDIWTDSNQQKGATFYFTIPFITGQAENVNKTNSAKQEPATELNKTNSTILIAEDIENNYMLLDNFLQKNGLKTIWAKNGHEAVDICKENNVSMVLMDMKMPVMDGYKATREIRKFNNNIPIIAQTAYALEGESDRSLEAGCNDYISKPIDQQRLLQLLNKYLG